MVIIDKGFKVTLERNDKQRKSRLSKHNSPL